MSALTVSEALERLARAREAIAGGIVQLRQLQALLPNDDTALGDLRAEIEQASDGIQQEIDAYLAPSDDVLDVITVLTRHPELAQLNSREWLARLDLEWTARGSPPRRRVRQASED
jgi:hypothetical protein